MRKTHLTKLASLTCALVAYAMLNGCGSEKTAGLSYGTYDMTASASLAASDGLGAQLYATEADHTTRMAVFQVADEAFALAEAHEQAGTYDQWYASFIRPGETQPDGTAVAGVEVPDSE